MNDIYPLDIWHIIFQHCDLSSKLKLFSVCSAFNHAFLITDMYNIPYIYQRKLTDLVLKQKKFSKIIELDIKNDIDIYDISFLTNLKKLCILWSSAINQSDIRGLNLTELYIDYSTRINDVSFMTNLKKLSIIGHYGVNQYGIQGLDLVELNASHNINIKDVSFMTNLKKLYIGGSCGIDRRGINGLNLTILETFDNPHFKN